MGRRNRERVERIRLGQEESHREKVHWGEEQRKLDALERVAEQFPGQGELLADVIREVFR